MAKNLVIVESPAKARTLTKYLGRAFQVKASVGHVVDLPKSKLGVDIENDFAPELTIIHGKKKVVDELKKAAKNKEVVYLAPDPDREGEAIAWHIADQLGPDVHCKRVLFNEITKKAVKAAIDNPLELHRGRYDAQTARRVLDRLVGYQLSPLLWDKIRRGLSAGRVQSVAVRVICEREAAIEAFNPVEYWSIAAKVEGENPPPFTAQIFKADGVRVDNKKKRVENEAEAKALVADVEKAEWKVVKVEKKERKRRPSPPFITSSLQQEASRKLGYAPRRTMGLAQRLYEGVELGDAGAVGLITYMRTDSVRLSDDAISSAREFIGGKFGKEYVPGKPTVFKTKKSAQDAHEAIRPTSVEYPPDEIARFLQKDELALYTLVWNRFIACQMTPALFDQTAVDISADKHIFRATGQVMRFDGFIRVYTEGRDDPTAEESDDDDEKRLPDLSEGDVLQLHELLPEQHFTQPPPRFTQASLIKELEEQGIGRPSTYAAIMGKVIAKEYVSEDQGKRLRPTHLGKLVTEMLVASFPDVLNVEFTAGMEELLDKVEEGEQPWAETIRDFYGKFSKDLERAKTEMKSVKGEGQATDLICEKCQQPMVIKWGRQGEFLACTGYPECKNTSDFEYDEEGKLVIIEQEVPEEPCKKCGKEMQVRYGKFGKFLGCTGYPECKSIVSLKSPPKSLNMVCPKCDKGDVQEKTSRRGKTFYGCDQYPDCDFATWDPPVIEPCPTCGSKYLVDKVTKRYGRQRKCVQEGCTYKESMEDDGLDAAPPESDDAAEAG